MPEKEDAQPRTAQAQDVLMIGALSDRLRPKETVKKGQPTQEQSEGGWSASMHSGGLPPQKREQFAPDPERGAELDEKKEVLEEQHSISIGAEAAVPGPGRVPLARPASKKWGTGEEALTEEARRLFAIYFAKSANQQSEDLLRQWQQLGLPPLDYTGGSAYQNGGRILFPLKALEYEPPPATVKGASGRIYTGESLFCLKPHHWPRRPAIHFVEWKPYPI